LYYKAISIGVNNRKLVPEKDVITTLSELYQKDPNKDYYVSVFRYNQRHYDQFQKTNSLAGIKDVKTKTLLFDFDDKANPENARQDTITLVDRLTSHGISSEQINVSFSGNKGTHVEVNFNQELTRDEVNNIRNTMAKDLTSNDPSVKDEQRLLRAVLSKNNKSGLYKIPLTVNELRTLTVDQIKNKATEVTDSHMELAEKQLAVSIDIPKQLEQLKYKKELVKPKSIVVDSPDFNKNKTGLTNAKYALSEGYFEEGERHEAIMILSATFLGLGWHKELTYNALKATLRLRAERLGIDDLNDESKRELWREVEQVYSPLWKGGMYSEDTNELLIATKERYNIQDKYDRNLLINLPQINNIFADFATNIDKNTLKLGIPSFDQEIRVTTSTLVSILAAPSAGKSSISFGILNSTSKEGIKSMFFSLDMAAPQVYQRLAQRHTGYHSDRLFSAYQNKDTAVIDKVEKTLEDEYKNVKFCFRGAMNVDIIRDALLKEKDLTGEFPKLIVVDYLENVLTDLSNDPTIAKGFVARSLKDIANEFAICVILLTQPAKVTGGPAEELNSYFNIKGSGLVAEASAQVITMHRPGFDPKNPADDNFITLTVVKNRMGTLGTFDYHWEGVRGTIRELTSEESQTLKVVREQNFAKKKGMSDL
jgi:KaiC/GvpD/RAD55 family RecA-like ATPase